MQFGYVAEAEHFEVIDHHCAFMALGPAITEEKHQQLIPNSQCVLCLGDLPEIALVAILPSL